MCLAEIARSHPVEIKVGDSNEEAECKLITETLNATLNNKSHAARMLGISRRALYNKLEKYNRMI